MRGLKGILGDYNENTLKLVSELGLTNLEDAIYTPRFFTFSLSAFKQLTVEKLYVYDYVMRSSK